MISTPVPTTIAELLQTVTQSTANITKHRQAMAKVAAQAKAAQPQPQPTGGEAK
jgi:uncharacterized coiled-coil protein SlyX